MAAETKPPRQQPPIRTMSGRGGAGNIKGPTPQGAQSDAPDLKTPTIKQSTYTTGRGGTGNMAKNDPEKPEMARAAQDVEVPEHHKKEMEGTYHWGRGGEGNKVTLGQDRRNPSKPRTGSFKNPIELGKAALGLGKKKEGGAGAGKEGESAIED